MHRKAPGEPRVRRSALILLTHQGRAVLGIRENFRADVPEPLNDAKVVVELEEDFDEDGDSGGPRSDF